MTEQVSDLSNIQQVMNRLEDLEERIEEVEDRQLKIMGGRQPENKLTVFNNGERDKGPSPEAAKVLKKTKKATKSDPVTKHDVKQILIEKGIERNDKAILNFMENIGMAFSKYKFRKGKGSRPAQLWRRSDLK